jgi:flagellar FliJ protein
MAFKFRLTPLKKHRAYKLSEAQAAHGAAIAAKMRVQTEIDKIKETIRLHTELFEKEQKKGIEAAKYLNFKNHLLTLERELLLAYKRMEKAAMVAEKHKQVMIECDKSVKTIENIESRDKSLYRLIQARKEQKNLDDVAVMSAYRNRTGSQEGNHEG